MGQWQRLLFPIDGLVGIGGDSLSTSHLLLKSMGIPMGMLIYKYYIL